MRLVADDTLGIYFWVMDEEVETVEVSPRFDYLEDAETWYRRLREHSYTLDVPTRRNLK